MILRKMVERKAFVVKPSVNIVYPNKENVFMMPNHENNGYKLPESKFVSLGRWAMILRKIGEGKVFFC